MIRIQIIITLTQIKIDPLVTVSHCFPPKVSYQNSERKRNERTFSSGQLRIFVQISLLIVSWMPEFTAFIPEDAPARAHRYN